jgi:hypothetical protein
MTLFKEGRLNVTPQSRSPLIPNFSHAATFGMNLRNVSLWRP